jgi:hypothetical protein
MAGAIVLVRGVPEEVLLRGARALRRLGARLTRYDAEEGTLEAQARRGRTAGLVRLRVEDGGRGLSRVRIDGEWAGGGWLGRGAGAWTIRRLRAELERNEPG